MSTLNLRTGAALICTCLMLMTVAARAQGDPRPPVDDKRAQAMKELGTRLAAVKADDAEGFYQVAKWARSKRLFGDMRRIARKAIAVDPDHEGARLYLGEMKVNGKWMKKARAMKELGYVRYKSRWYNLDEYAKLRAEEGRKKRQIRLDREVNRLVRRMSSRSDELRTRSRDQLIAFARKEGLDHLVPKARKLHDELDAYWARVRAYETATVEVRLQQAKLTRLRRFQTSLGTGSPVTLELPEVQRTSIGTTVLVPVGR